MPNVDYLGLLVAVVAVVISFVALIRSRKLAERQLELEQQHAKLAKKQLEQIEEQERHAQLAQVDVALEGYGGSWSVVVRNLGYSDARNVEIRWTSEEPRFIDGEPEQKLPIARLKPNKGIELKAAFHMGSPTHYEGIVTWTNSDGSLSQDDFELHM